MEMYINIKFNFDEKQNYYLKSDSWGYYSIWLLLDFCLWLPTANFHTDYIQFNLFSHRLALFLFFLWWKNNKFGKWEKIEWMFIIIIVSIKDCKQRIRLRAVKDSSLTLPQLKFGPNANILFRNNLFADNAFVFRPSLEIDQ